MALHAGRVEHCRLNGCQCQAFRPTPQPVAQAPEAVVPQSLPIVSVQTFTVILTGLGFAAGLLLGLKL